MIPPGMDRAKLTFKRPQVRNPPAPPPQDIETLHINPCRVLFFFESLAFRTIVKVVKALLLGFPRKETKTFLPFSYCVTFHGKKKGTLRMVNVGKQLMQVL